MSGQPAQTGVLLQARVKWWHSDTVRVFQGRYASLTVAPNDLALNGATITFHVVDANGESLNQAAETSTYNTRNLTPVILNLTFP